LYSFAEFLFAAKTAVQAARHRINKTAASKPCSEWAFRQEQLFIGVLGKAGIMIDYK